MFTRPFPRLFIVLIVVIALVNALATAFFLYWRIPWLDMVMHALGGFWVGGAFLWWYYFARRNVSKHRDLRRVYIAGVSVLAVLVVGGLWELFEFVVDEFAGRETYDLLDTASDFVFDTIGALLVAGYFVWRRHHLQAHQTYGTDD